MKKNILFGLALASAMTATATNISNIINNVSTEMPESAATSATKPETAANAPAMDVELTGCVVDSLTHEGEPMATLRVWKMGETRDNSKATAMGTTDVNGRFSLQLKQKGQYVLMISSIGRNPIIRPFGVEKGQKVIDLGTLLMSESAEELQDVVVAVQRPIVKMEGDKIAYSVKDDPDAKTNTLMEMLRKVPMVTVDGEDNIQVNGSSNFQIFMNGKPSPMLSGNPKETLKAIPAQSIKHIEVLTNPGAKYDAEGVGGILNFVTDQQQGMEGYTGSLSLQSGNRLNGGTAYVMVQKDKLTLSVNASEMVMNTPAMDSKTERRNLVDGSTMTTDVTNSGHNNMAFATVDANYQIDDQNVVSASVNMMDMRSKSEMEMATSVVPGSEYSQLNNNKMTSTSVNASIDYTHTFGGSKDREFEKSKKRELDRTITPASNSSNTSNFSNSSNTSTPSNSSNSSNFSTTPSTLTLAYRFSNAPRKNDMETEYIGIEQPAFDRIDKNNMQEHTLQLDYTLPLDMGSTFETGGKYVYRLSTSLSDLLDYEHENSIGALYATYSQPIGKLTLKGGLRYEYTSQDVTYKKGNGEDFSLTYSNLVPNLTLSVPLNSTPSNFSAPSSFSTSTLSLAYNMRISRPGISVLNPYRNTQDLHNVSFGNPNLEVETSHNLQLTYSYFSAKAMLNASLRYSYLDNGVEQYSYLNDGVLYSTYGNIGQRQNTALSLFASLSLSAKTRLTLNSTTSYVDLRASEMGYSNNGFSEMAMINLQQTLPWDLKLSAMYMINTPSVTLQGETAGMNMHMLGLTKSFLDDRLSVGINTMNPFHSTMTMKTTTEGADYINTSESKVSMGTVIVNASYRFGDLKMKQQARRTEMESDVLDVKSSSEQINGVFMQ